MFIIFTLGIQINTVYRIEILPQRMNDCSAIVLPMMIWVNTPSSIAQDQLDQLFQIAPVSPPADADVKFLWAMKIFPKFTQSLYS